MPLSRQTILILGIGCGVIVLSLGITAAVLGAKGYFGYDDPCIGVYDFSIVNLDMTTNTEEKESSSILGMVDGFTESLGLGSLASQIMPTQATMTIELILEVNNTNPYDMDYEQTDEGVITIPDDAGAEGDEDTTAARQGEDTEGQGLVVGTWEFPSGTLKKNARNQIPVTVTATIDLLGSDALGLAGTFATNGPLAFEVDGGIEGEGWVPGISGKTKFFCMARVEKVLEAASNGGEDATIRCKHSTSLGRRLRGLQSSGETDESDNLWALLGQDDEVDPSCYV